MSEKSSGLPEDLTAISEEELGELESNAVTEFDELFADENLDDEGLERLTNLRDQITSVRNEQVSRTEAAEAKAEQLSALKNDVHGADEITAEADDEIVEGEVVEETAKEPALVSGTSIAKKKSLNPTLAEIRKNAPKVRGPRPSTEAVLVASADIPGFTLGGKLDGMAALTAAMSSRARSLPDQRGQFNKIPVAQLQRSYTHTLGPDAMPNQIDEVVRRATDPEALVAAGGWCAPSEISYDFYNIVCEDGMIDLPTVGINRGGLRWPVSPSFGDLVDDPALWGWTETQDIAAATGTAQSGTKTCGIVPCAEFDEERLDCDGYCLTVGNLMDDAFPELIANHIRLLFAAHAHKMNALYIQNLVALSEVTGTVGVTGVGVVAPVLGAIEMQAIDYREKFAMCDDAILEVILPRWLRGAMRSDLAKRMGGGLEMLSVADATIMSWLTDRNIRAQWVGDWQVRAPGFPGGTDIITTWPDEVQFMMYAAGTFVKGNGLTLDLGVIRDSALNETNDFTAEWSEECWLIGRIGHESRVITVPICPNGTTGAANITSCDVA